MSSIGEFQKEQTANATVRWSLLGATAPGTATQSIVVPNCSFRIGRRPDMDLRIDSPVVSGSHAELFQSGGNLYVRDSGSTNGTFVDGIRITGDTLLSDGAALDVGDTGFRVVKHFHNATGPEAAALYKRTCSSQDVFNVVGRRSLSQLLNGGEALPCYQAIHCLKTGAVIGHEYLVRTALPGIETPGRLFEQARKAGREIELSKFCRAQGMQFSHLIPSCTPVFLNTHPMEPLLDVVVPHMLELQKQYSGRAMVLEVHEAADTEPGLIREARRRLAAVGIKLAFDDFGCGQARMRELISASTDYIKFDPSLLRELQQVSAEQLRLFTAIIRGIQGEGVIAVAEGVETEEMATMCREIGFDLVQGYLFSRPSIL